MCTGLTSTIEALVSYSDEGRLRARITPRTLVGWTEGTKESGGRMADRRAVGVPHDIILAMAEHRSDGEERMCDVVGFPLGIVGDAALAEVEVWWSS